MNQVKQSFHLGYCYSHCAIETIDADILKVKLAVTWVNGESSNNRVVRQTLGFFGGFSFLYIATVKSEANR
jgi:hypothetical protein